MRDSACCPQRLLMSSGACEASCRYMLLAWHMLCIGTLVQSKLGSSHGFLCFHGLDAAEQSDCPTHMSPILSQPCCSIHDDGCCTVRGLVGKVCTGQWCTTWPVLFTHRCNWLQHCWHALGRCTAFTFTSHALHTVAAIKLTVQSRYACIIGWTTPPFSCHQAINR